MILNLIATRIRIGFHLLYLHPNLKFNSMWLCNIKTFAEMFVNELSLYDVNASFDDLKICSLHPLTLSYDCDSCYCKFVEYDKIVRFEINYKD